MTQCGPLSASRMRTDRVHPRASRTSAGLRGAGRHERGPIVPGERRRRARVPTRRAARLHRQPRARTPAPPRRQHRRRRAGLVGGPGVRWGGEGLMEGGSAGPSGPPRASSEGLTPSRRLPSGMGRRDPPVRSWARRRIGANGSRHVCCHQHGGNIPAGLRADGALAPVKGRSGVHRRVPRVCVCVCVCVRVCVRARVYVCCARVGLHRRVSTASCPMRTAHHLLQ